ncbi:NADH dehydrogenase [ubiquinone] 1 alpha subcomplex subunit 11-like [Cebus imitator]|uniref:NADH dehydrogenase [ubiquinone] 1 alpha subcomplex subunit 11-like n=1 Tax=Cebus imitator TaxID=2715852 RepID=UPI0018974D72|nr:NADH dehydrogenase [ubiquinone] 1 alpha subcomplex subunit 11-like [Cebus imitator]
MAPRIMSQFWDIPDGTDCHRKAVSATATGTVVGGTAAAYSITLNPASNFLDGALRAGRYTFTGAAVGAVSGLTSCITAQVRQKPDDPLNYFLGDCAGGLTVGSRMRNYEIGAACCVYFGIAAARFKMGGLEGWQLFPKPEE